MDADNQTIYNLYIESQQREPILWVSSNGTRIWGYTGDDGLRYYHRENGPAKEWVNGAKEWWLNGKLHRLDGPACEYLNGEKYWFIGDIEYTAERWAEQVLKLQNKPHDKQAVQDFLRSILKKDVEDAL